MKSLTPLLIIVICIGMYFAYIKPAGDEIKYLSLQKTEYNNVLIKSKELKQKRDAVLIDYNSIPADDIEKLNKVVPETFNSVAFINDLNTHAAKYGMVARDFKENEPKPETREAVLNQSGDSYKTTVVSFSVTGQYSQFLRFLSDLESSLRLLDVIGITIRSANRGVVGDTALVYSLELKTYSLR